MDRFFIFGLARSGTTSLASVLTTGGPVVQEPLNELSGDLVNHSSFESLLREFGRHPEQLQRSEDEEDRWAWNRLAGIAEDRVECAKYLEWLYGHFRGVKHVWTSLSESANLNVIDWCLSNNIKLVFQTRRKMAHALLSEKLASQTGIWQAGVKAEDMKRWNSSSFDEIDVEKFEKRLALLKEEQKLYLGHLRGSPYFLLRYEDLYLRPVWRRKRVFSRLCKFLNIEKSAVDQEWINKRLFNPQHKQTRQDTLERIPNYSQLKKFL